VENGPRLTPHSASELTRVVNRITVCGSSFFCSRQEEVTSEIPMREEAEGQT